MRTADIVIIGAGVSGCSIASHLLRLDPGLSVVLLDAEHVGAGSTSRSTAAFRHQWSVPVHVAFSRYGSKEYDRLTELGFPIGFRRNGYLFLFTEPASMAKADERVQRQRRLGVEGVEVLNPLQLTRSVPGGEFIRDPDLVGATWGPSDGFLDPLAVAQAYLDEARKCGVQYLPGVEVSALLTQSQRPALLGVRTRSGEILSTGRVVNAAGVWAGPVSETAGLKLPVCPAKRYLYHSHPIRDRDVSNWPLIIGDCGAHVRPAEGNTLLMAWEHRPDPLAVSPSADTLRNLQDLVEPGYGLGTDDYGVQILARLSRHIPFLADAVGLSGATCGWYAITPDHKAILGEDPRLPGLFHATGFSGHGIMHAAATGRTLAELVLGRDPSLAGSDEIKTHFGLEGLLEGRLREPVEEMVL